MYVYVCYICVCHIAFIHYCDLAFITSEAERKAEDKDDKEGRDDEDGDLEPRVQQGHLDEPRLVTSPSIS